MTSLIDWKKSACLCGDGLPDYVAAECVNQDGTTSFWLVSKEHLDAEDAPAGNPNQSHEKLGRLPGLVRDRIWGDRLRCGRPRYDGQPCRQRVKEPGQPCGQHSGKEAVP